ncbi:Zn-ribbon domain-containing OB-fold protein [Aeropyrum pernix]|uniref:Zn-ribbon domain-containing OB-fold protein n=1 Tax=Aeropyrum pernix TaxID=56636 RepID=UPI001FB524A2|nr:Zn-ribbon domain-containing OB-fold protein [Aeropyrum pernix]
MVNAQWSKNPWNVYKFPGRMEVEKYVYTPGLHGLEFAKALKEGRIIGTKCGDTVYVPPTTFCPDMSRGEVAEVLGPWYIESYTVVYESLDGKPLEKPVVIAVIAPEDAEGALVHYVDADPDEVYIGMPVEPVFKPPEERSGNILDILHFKPTAQA